MNRTHCVRCRVEEDIPTWQFVKFDHELHWLCAKCWEAFRQWFHRNIYETGVR